MLWEILLTLSLILTSTVCEQYTIDFFLVGIQIFEKNNDLDIQSSLASLPFVLWIGREELY